MPRQPACLFDHSFNAVEINNGLALLAKNFSMLLSIFNQHTRADGRYFKSAHRMAVAIRPPHQAQRDFRSADSLTRSLQVGVAAVIRPRLSKSRPISSIERNLESRAG